MIDSWNKTINSYLIRLQGWRVNSYTLLYRHTVMVRTCARCRICHCFILVDVLLKSFKQTYGYHLSRCFFRSKIIFRSWSNNIVVVFKVTSSRKKNSIRKLEKVERKQWPYYFCLRLMLSIFIINNNFEWYKNNVNWDVF